MMPSVLMPQILACLIVKFRVLCVTIFVLSFSHMKFKTLDVEWTASLQDEVKVLGERFTGGPHDRPDLIASHCPDKKQNSVCLRR